MAYPVPENEVERLATLYRYHILDTMPEIGFDEISELAAQLCSSPVALISFVDDDRSWLKAKYGLPPDLNQIPREMSFCATTILSSDIVVSPDLSQDQRFSQMPAVAGEPHFKFYCGMPLITHDGYALGTLCVLDFQSRDLPFSTLESIRRLSHQVMTQLELKRQLVEFDTMIRELHQARREVDAEKARAESLLTDILPRSIAEELRKNGKVEPKFIPSATILFTDFKAFTLLAERIEPAALIGLLDQYFSAFDEIVMHHGLEKLKTIGDAYMAVAGAPIGNRQHPFDACLAALDIQGALLRINAQRERMRLPILELRVGLHTGPLMAGVVGKRKFTYDIWGDAVNIAALMEAHGAPGLVNVSATVAGHVAPLFELEPRGSIAGKHKGEMQMFFLHRLKPEFAADAEGRRPNNKFAAERNRLLTGYAG